ncbi:unnamed protein product [Urochloa decumbens]|uniref:Neprosin PEP catalytic domain-containing protein n=1 Tax=Urochloa decumbens TaxID=240449 RepID=A0ABC9G6F2_9POAL
MWRTEPGKFYGLRAEISIWGSPDQQDNQESGASILVTCEQDGRVASVQAGFDVKTNSIDNWFFWTSSLLLQEASTVLKVETVCGSVFQVTTYLHDNRDVRFFTYWTRDVKNSPGCYNLKCPGFVPANGAALVPGQAVAPPSVYGEQNHYVTISLNKDPNSGDWVVYRHDLETPSFLGHFPGDICPSTPRSLALTGFVSYPKSAQGPPMGSGHFPDDQDDKKTAYFKHIKLYDAKGNTVDPITTPMVRVVDRPDCYGETQVIVKIKSGYMFYYGGPPGCRRS